MTERMESLLSDLVTLTREQLTNQREALDNQKVSLERQAKAIGRSRRIMMFNVVVLVLVIATFFLAPLLNWIVRRGP